MDVVASGGGRLRLVSPGRGPPACKPVSLERRAPSVMLRVTGKVVRTDGKSGEKINATTGEVRPWAFDVIKVLVADQAIVEVTRFADSLTPLPGVGTEVDYAVDVNARAGRVNVQLDKPWADLFPAAGKPVVAVVR